MLDLLFVNAQIASDGAEFTADVAVQDGQIKAIGKLDDLPAKEVIQCRGKILLPGIVDLGVNLLDNGPFDPESGAGFAASARAAALGGVTTMISTIEIDPQEVAGDAVKAQQEADSRKASIDFGYHLLLRHVEETTANQLRSAYGAGICSVWAARTSLSDSYPGHGLLMALAQIIPEEMLLLVTPWDAISGELYRRVLKTDPAALETQWLKVLPREIEANFVRSLPGVLAGLRGRALVAGVSCAESIVALQELAQRSTHFQAACGLPSLYFVDSETGAPRTWPPIREKSDQQALYYALEQGLISVVTSDHKPRTAAEMVGQPNAPSGPAVGLATISHLLPILYSEGVSKWRITLATLSQILCADAAKLAGLYPRKGTIQPGADADLVLLDPLEIRRSVEQPVDVGPLDHIDPLKEATLQGVVKQVYLRGVKIVENGELVAENTGQYQARRLALK
ncbi:amidohydrolase family protein [bacterium]|nr:amidohydrolase family protein [bacterium]